MTPELTATMISAIAAAVSVIIVHLRKRQDVSVAEMQERIQRLEERSEALMERIGHYENENGNLRAELIIATRRIFILERTLARHGIPDPESEQPL